jgi:hypothetical protein
MRRPHGPCGAGRKDFRSLWLRAASGVSPNSVFGCLGCASASGLLQAKIATVTNSRCTPRHAVYGTVQPHWASCAGTWRKSLQWQEDESEVIQHGFCGPPVLSILPQWRGPCASRRECFGKGGAVERWRRLEMGHNNDADLPVLLVKAALGMRANGFAHRLLTGCTPVRGHPNQWLCGCA